MDNRDLSSHRHTFEVQSHSSKVSSGTTTSTTGSEVQGKMMMSVIVIPLQPSASEGNLGTGAVEDKSTSSCSDSVGSQASVRDVNDVLLLNGDHSDSECAEYLLATSFLQKVRDRFQTQQEKYLEFLKVLQTYEMEYDNGGTTFHLEKETYRQITNLFEGHPDLIVGLQEFLPWKAPLTNPQFKKATLAPDDQYGSIADFSFFDKVRRLMHSDKVFDNFMRALELFSNGNVTGSELLQIVTPFLSKSPTLLAQFKDSLVNESDTPKFEPAYCGSTSKEISDEKRLNIDYFTCKRIGANYCAIPRDKRSKCSGRTELCNEVLNDTWIAVSTEENEGSGYTRVSTAGSYVTQCEEERFEVDFVIQINKYTIRYLEAVVKNMSKMSQQELQAFKLDDCLGGSSPTIHQQAIKKVYGDRAGEIIEGLKSLPAVTVPVVLKRLRAKQQEWNEARVGFNKIWGERMERYYLKSLDYQEVPFKLKDNRRLQSKFLVKELEAIYEEHNAQNATQALSNSKPTERPHLTLSFNNPSIIHVASDLLTHYARERAILSSVAVQKIEDMLSKFIPDLFNDSKTLICETTVESGGLPRQGDPRFFYVNMPWYAFLRLFQIFCERLVKFQDMAEALAKPKSPNEQVVPNKSGDITRDEPQSEEAKVYFRSFTQLLRDLLHGNLEVTSYEDQLRKLFGVQGYIGYTLDKVVINAVRELQTLVTDETCLKVVELYTIVKEHDFSDGSTDAATFYQKRAVTTFAGKQCVRVTIFKNENDVRMTMKLLKFEAKKKNKDECFVNYKSDAEIQETTQRTIKERPLFLQRNKGSVKLFTINSNENQDVDPATTLNPAKATEISFMYRKKGLKRLLKTFKSMSSISSRMKTCGAWHIDWLLQNTTRAQRKECADWLKQQQQ